MRVFIFFVVAVWPSFFITAYAAAIFTTNRSDIQLPSVLSIPAGLEVGGVIWTSKTLSMTVSGSATDAAYFRAGTNSSTSVMGNTYATNIPGVAIRYVVLMKAPKFPEGKYLVVDTAATAVATGWRNGDVYQQDITIELVKYGNIRTAGSASVSNSLIFTAGQFPNSPIYTRWNVVTSGQVGIGVGSTCKVTTPSVSVPMGKVSTFSLSAVGSVSNAMRFELSLSCSGGDAGVSLYPAVTVTDVSNPANVGDRLGLTAGSTATGVAIQVLHDGEAIKFGADSASAQNTNRWKAGEIKSGAAVFKIPLSSRYIRTSAPLLPGTANGEATFTLSYE